MMARARATNRCGAGEPCRPALKRPAPPNLAPGNQAMLRRLAHARAATPADPAPPMVRHVLRDSGRPLDRGVRAYFERGLGADLGAVRVHTDERADRSAQAVDALAFAVGPDLVFRAGRYAPSEPAGLQLLAHELAHVAQSPQTAPAGASLRIGEISAPEERQAAVAAERLAAGERAGAQSPAGEPALRRQTSDDDPKPAVKPLIPIPFFDKFDVKPFGPSPGSSGPSPYDAPNKAQDIPGGGPSMEDLNSGAHALFDKNNPKVVRHAGKMPGCEALETPDSSRTNRHYQTFEQYELSRKLYHDPFTSKQPWPILSQAEYNSFVDACPKSEPSAPQLQLPPAEKPPLQDAPGPALPPGQAYA